MARYCVFFLLGACLLLAACEPVAIAILGASASAALRYNMDGVASRTFTAPVAAVKSASIAALERMGLALDSTSRFDTGETIFARAENRDIEIDIEPITKHATRVRITAKGGSLLYDNATAGARKTIRTTSATPARNGRRTTACSRATATPRRWARCSAAWSAGRSARARRRTRTGRSRSS